MPQNAISAEIVTGTGITGSSQKEWTEATRRLRSYIEDLKGIKGLDLDKKGK